MVVRTRHVGSYGLCVREDRILLIRKARGPYAGFLDLPGGGIEHGESPEDALRREFAEETGLVPLKTNWLCDFSALARYVNSDGEEEELHHLGFIWSITIGNDTRPKPDSDDQDSLGSAWHPLDGLAESSLTPVARAALVARARRNCQQY